MYLYIFQHVINIPIFMIYVPIFITLLCSVPIFITDAYMFTYFYNKNVPIITIQSPYFYNGLSGSVPIFINSRLEGEGGRLRGKH
jgi:hypothetical protein